MDVAVLSGVSRQYTIAWAHTEEHLSAVMHCRMYRPIVEAGLSIPCWLAEWRHNVTLAGTKGRCKAR